MSIYKRVDIYQEIQVNTLEEIYNIIDEYNSFRNLPRPIEDGRLLQTLYRGQCNSNWDISPSLLRAEISENKMLNKFVPDRSLSLFGTIAYIQHHYTGTRFIDFTTNPDVAIFFACVNSNDTDGAVFLYDYAPHEAEWYTTIILSELVRIEGDSKISVQSFADRVLEYNPALRSNFSSMDELNGSIISFLDNGFMVSPDSKSIQENLRLKRQQGCFFVCGVEFDPPLTSSARWCSRAGRNQFYPHSAIVPSELKYGHTLAKIIIAKECKQAILQYLEGKGITYDYLLPE